MEHPQQQPRSGGRRRGPEPPTLDEEDPSSELLRKASWGDVAYLNRFPGDPLLVQDRDKHGDTALHLASRFGHLEFVNEILNRLQRLGSSNLLRSANENGDTALHEAIQHKHVAIAKKLLEKDSTLLADAYGNSSLLYLAAEGGLEEVVNHLADHAGVRYDGPNGATALHAAVKSVARSIIVPLLLKKRPDLRNKVDSHGDLPLHHAAYLGDKKTVSLLLGDDDSVSTCVYHPNKDGNTPIHMAAMAGHLPVMRLLVDKCPEGGTVVNNRGRNALHVAIQHERSNVVEYILQEPRLGRLVYQKDEDGNGPLHLAARHWNREILRLLLDDPKVNKLARNRKQQTALDVFLEKEEPEHTLQWYGAHLLLRKTVPRVPETEDNIEEELKMNRELNLKAEREIQSRVEKGRGNIMTMAALVAAVTFAAAFTVPGGYRSDSGAQTGLPILLRAAAFKIFIVFDLVTLITSLSAMFLCVYATWDDVHSVPHLWMAIRLLMIFSFAGMTTAFAAGMYTILAAEALWLAVLVCAMCGALPVLAYVRAKSRFLKLLILRLWRKATTQIRYRICNDPSTRSDERLSLPPGDPTYNDTVAYLYPEERIGDWTGPTESK